MANVEIVNAHHSITSDAHHHHRNNHPRPLPHLTSVDLEESGEGDGGLNHSSPSINDDERQEDDKTRQGYGTMGDGGEKGKWTGEQVEQMRRRLKFFFMDPYNKFKARLHIPWKMCLQFLKIIIITVQLIQFGGQRSDIVEYFERNDLTLSHLLLKDWEAGYETMPYPPASGVYALYTVEDLLDSIDFAWAGYHNLSNSSLATIVLLKRNGTVVPMRLCNSFNNYDTYPNGSYIVGPGILHNCTELNPLEGNDPYNIRLFLRNKTITIPFTKLLDLTLDFSFNTFHLNLIETHYGPNCYRVNGTILFENKERSGQVVIKLTTKITERTCSGKVMSPEAKEEEDLVRRRNVAFDACIIIVCIFSIILCARSMFRACKLKRLTMRMFRERFGKELSFSDGMEFVNLWYVLIIVNDVFTIIGTSIKIKLETRSATITSHNYDNCSLMLGLGGLLAWMGCLRYLSFFRKYNILILTLKTAFPNVLRFSLCALAMYCGFMFCGWVILSPYHIKFRHLSTASECLYSLVNGDDMFVTFTATETDNLVVWYFSRIYLYIFISLFIYCVLSLFISVIMDTYETLKEYYEKGFPKTELQTFIEQCSHQPHSGMFRRQHTDNEARDWSLIGLITKLCSRKKTREEEEEQRALLTQTI